VAAPQLHIPPVVPVDVQTPLGAAALAYVRLGWLVFPLWPRSKQPLHKPGYLMATWDPAQIREWWRGNPRYNVGVVTGAGLIALDIDPAKGGQQWWDTHRDLTPPTATSHTGGGGYHLLCQVGSDVEIRNSVGKIARGIDVRGDGGYIVAPPSIHPNGRPYRWIPGRAPWEIRRAPLASVLISRLLEPPRSRRLASAIPARIPEGERNTTLFSLAGTMRRRNMSLEAIVAALRIENTARCEPPLDDEEVMAIVRSISRYSPAC